MNQRHQIVLPAINNGSIALYSSEQIYAMEQAWFAEGYNSFALMQQAAWQMAQQIIQAYNAPLKYSSYDYCYQQDSSNQRPRANIWVGQGDNGGDGWLVALYLQQAGWQVQIITVGQDEDHQDNKTGHINKQVTTDNLVILVTDAKKAQQMAVAENCPYQHFDDNHFDSLEIAKGNQPAARTTRQISYAEVYVDALFGIGLDRKPGDHFEQAIKAFNNYAKADKAWVVAIDIPSGLIASTGQVYDHVAIQADVTLCLIARKFGLHTKDGMDYAGTIIDIPLIPYKPTFIPKALLLTKAQAMPIRRQNSHKGSYGHVLIIGGNRIAGSQGMGGAAILAASSAMATGAGKMTVACHSAFHGALLTLLPDAMTIDLHDKSGVKRLIQEANVVAIGMGLGRDETAKRLFADYLKAAMLQHKAIIIDADGLYHLADLHLNKNALVNQFKAYSKKHKVCLTPHSGEAAKLLQMDVNAIEADRLTAIVACAQLYGGNWVLKGAGSLVLVQSSAQHHLYVCGIGNPGMATAGMGDILSGTIAGLLAQQDLKDELSSLAQAVLIHSLAGDSLVGNGATGDPAGQQLSYTNLTNTHLSIGQRGLKAQDMPEAIRHIMHLLTIQ